MGMNEVFSDLLRSDQVQFCKSYFKTRPGGGRKEVLVTRCCRRHRRPLTPKTHKNTDRSQVLYPGLHVHRGIVGVQPVEVLGGGGWVGTLRKSEPAVLAVSRGRRSAVKSDAFVGRLTENT